MLAERRLDRYRQRCKPAVARHKPREYVASQPLRVLSWDITYMRSSTVRGGFFYLYVFLDIWSRRIVGAEVHESQQTELAASLLDKVCRDNALEANKLVVHSDNGAPMKGCTMLAMMQSLGVTASFSRPSVSDDNAFAEALFRHLKYAPSYPRNGFASINDARAWVSRFVHWYNKDHLHSAIGLVTPEQRHDGDDIAILDHRRRTYALAQARNPRRWTSAPRAWTRPATVTLNPDRVVLTAAKPAVSAAQNCATTILTNAAERGQKTLARHGRTLDSIGESDVAEPLGEQLALAALCAGAGQGLTGDHAGEPLLRVVDPARARRNERVGESSGFNVHAEVAVPARDRAQLERLCRYLCRPPIARERLEETASGKLRYTLKRPWRDGTIAIVLEPLDLLARVCALIPPPRFHMVRYHGVLSSHAKARPEVVPRVEDATVVQLPLFKQDKAKARAETVLPPEPRRKPWAWLLRHVFEIDVSTCPRCGGATRWLEAATKPDATARLLAKHGLGPRPPPKPPAKGQLRLGFSMA